MYEAFLQLVPILASLLILLQFLHDVSQKTENNKKILRPGVNFIKLTFILQNAKIFRALSMFNFKPSRGGLEVEVWTDNSLHSASVGSNPV